MNTLTFTKTESAGADCPPKDTYVLRLVEWGEFHEKPAFDDPTTINTQSRVSFEIEEFDYDEEEDDRDWNGERLSDFFVFFKQPQSGERKETWKNERSNAYALLTALLGHEIEDGENVDLPELVGRRIKATVEPKKSGWPKIKEPVAYKKRRKKAAPVVEDDGAFDEDE